MSAKTRAKFKLAGIVRLKSGGPAMTIGDVYWVAGDPDTAAPPCWVYKCVWFKPDGDVADEAFDEFLLDPVCSP